MKARIRFDGEKFKVQTKTEWWPFWKDATAYGNVAYSYSADDAKEHAQFLLNKHRKRAQRTGKSGLFRWITVEVRDNEN